MSKRVDFTVLHVINGVFAVVRSHAGHFKRAQAITITQGVVQKISSVSILQRQRSVDHESPVSSSAS